MVDLVASTMKFLQLLSAILPAAAVVAFEYEQTVLGNARVGEWVDEAKQVILDGKQNMEKWLHDGKEFIKQDGLMCE